MFGVNNYLTRYRGRISRSLGIGLDNLVSYVRGKEPSCGPFYIGWNITFRCNSRCAFCRSHEFVDKEPELTFGECSRIIREIGAKKTEFVTITGGEPLLRDDVFDIIKELKKQRITVNLVTNGALLQEKAKALIEARLDAVTVSVDAASPEKHDSLRGHPGLFKKAENGIRRMREMRGSSATPRIILSTVITMANYRQLEDIVAYWQDKADEIRFQPIHDSPGTNIWSVSDKTLLPKGQEKEEVAGCLTAFFNRHKKLSSNYESEFPAFFMDRRALAKRYRCFAGYFMLQIDAYGNVYPCPEFIANVGNLKKEAFKDVWHGARLKDFRKEIKGSPSCFCWYGCTGPLNYYLTKATSVFAHLKNLAHR